MDPVADCPHASSDSGPAKSGEGSTGISPKSPSKISSGKSTSRRIDFLDPIRGFAILLVYAYHSVGTAFGRDQLSWGHWFRNFNVPRSFLLLLPATLGWAGVAIFFVISGFCIHLSFSKSPQWSLFFWRRFFRIYPIYLVTLLFFTFAFPATRLHSISVSNANQFISHLFLFHNLGRETIFGINDSYWTIALEVQLYALHPLLIALVTRFGWRRSLVGIAAIEIGLRLAGGISWTFGLKGPPHYVTASPLFYWFSWSIGAYVAERHIRGTIRAIPKYSLYAIGTAAVAVTFFKPLYNMSFLLFALLTAGVIVAFLYKGEEHFPVPLALENHLQKAGLYSYSLYLWHLPFVHWVPRLVSRIAPGVHIHPLGMFAICIMLWLFVAVPMSRLSYQFFELPSISLGKILYARAKEFRTIRRPLAVVSE